MPPAQATPERSSKARRWLGVGTLVLVAAVGVAAWYVYRPRMLQPGQLLPVRSRTTNDVQGPEGPNRVGATTKVAVPNQRPVTFVDRKTRVADPADDDWQGEAFGKAVAPQLRRLEALLSGPFDEEAASSLLLRQFSCSALRPETMRQVYQVGPIQVRRGDVTNQNVQFIGSEGLRQALAVFRHDDTNLARSRVKLVRVRREEDHMITTLLVEILQQGARTVRQHNATWSCVWTGDGASTEEPPRLVAIRPLNYEEVELGTPEPAFVDCTKSAFAGADEYEWLVRRDINYWATRLSRLDDMGLSGHHGLAIGDVNNDGLDDLYVCDSGGLPNRLYLHQPDGTLREISSEAEVDWLEASRAALLVDLDNDGDQDLVVSTVALVLFAENRGDGRFRLRGGHPSVSEAYSLAAGDFDSDGRLDIYCCCYGASDSNQGSGPGGFEATAPVPYNDANNGGRNALLRNLGSFRFQDVTKRVGLDQNNTRWSFAAAWEDYDADGDVDLYVANDFGRNNLYRNEGGKFVDVAAEARVEDMAGGMSVDWGDWNRDGRLDLYVGNMYSAAGNRVTYARRFVESSGSRAPGIQRMARGNTLFTAQDDGSFGDDSETLAVNMGRWAWSSKFADLNNDGWLDLVVANGYITNEQTDDL